MPKECKECEKQARLLGMGANREAKLMAEISALKMQDMTNKDAAQKLYDLGREYREKFEATEKDRDAWKEKLETLAAHHERMMGLPDRWKDDADRMAEALKGVMKEFDRAHSPAEQHERADQMERCAKCVAAQKGWKEIAAHEKLKGGV